MSVGALLGFRPHTGAVGLFTALGVALVFAYAWSWVMVTVGLLVRTPEAVQAAGYLVLFPLAFASSVFAPSTTMPTWLRWFPDHRPVTAVTNAARGLTLGHGVVPAGHTLAGEIVAALMWSPRSLPSSPRSPSASTAAA